MQRVALHLLITALWVTASALSCSSQTSANAATAGGDVTRAVAEAQKAVQSNPEDGNSWEKLGLANLQAGNYHEAITALRTAVAKGYPAQTGNYNLACAYARAGESGKALDLLQALIAAGYPAPIASDPDLVSLSGEPRFKEMAAAVQRAREPCKDSQANPEYRQLDFWVGEWDVYSGTTKVGESSVQLILKDCVVFENWQGLQGSAGKSFNKFDPLAKRWEQFWVSDSGTTNYFKGALVDGEMRYVWESPNQSSATRIRHLTFSRLSNGNVRQLSEGSTDGGKTWTTEYDFTYIRKSGTKAAAGD